VGEELELEQRHQAGERPAEGRAELQVREDQQGDQAGPDLGVEGGSAGPHEGLDLEVLLERLEEELDLPAVLVDGRDGRGAEFQMVGQEYHGVPPTV